jgi:hypothetical protein
MVATEFPAPIDLLLTVDYAQAQWRGAGTAIIARAPKSPAIIHVRLCGQFHAAGQTAGSNFPSEAVHCERAHRGCTPGTRLQKALLARFLTTRVESLFWRGRKRCIYASWNQP